jgi:hypothetical protein
MFLICPAFGVFLYFLALLGGEEKEAVGGVNYAYGPPKPWHPLTLGFVGSCACGSQVGCSGAHSYFVSYLAPIVICPLMSAPIGFKCSSFTSGLTDSGCAYNFNSGFKIA